MRNSLNELLNSLKQIKAIESSLALMSWDREVKMPTAGAESRAEDLGRLSAFQHEKFTDPDLENQIQELLIHDLKDRTRKNLEILLDDIQKEKKLPVQFVEEFSKTISLGQGKWVEARKQNDFSIFEEALEKIIRLNRQKADYLGFDKHPYNALLNEFDKGSNIDSIDPIFKTLRNECISLLKSIETKNAPNTDILDQVYNEDAQYKLSIELCSILGLEGNQFILDRSEHPFTSRIAAKDLRLTTRINKHDIKESIWSTIHEAGHGLYELNLNQEEAYLPSGEASSLSVHESQSRFYENLIGKSKTFVNAIWIRLKDYFPNELKNAKADNFFKAINKVEPGLIRTSADELTYMLHIIIRYEIEKEMLSSELKVKELPDLWNAKYEEYLGLKVPDVKKGILQDIHWSHGAVGYFPTYALGSLLSSQLYNAMDKSINMQDRIENLDFSEINLWLFNNIYQHGRLLTTDEICRGATGSKLNSNAFISYMETKINEVYD